MTDTQRTARNVVMWGAVGFLFYGLLGTLFAVVMYLLLD